MATSRSRFLISTRDADAAGNWVAEPGPTRFFRVPVGADTYTLSQEIRNADRWRGLVADAADGEENEITGSTGDVLLFMHGYNNTIKSVLKRTRYLQDTLAQAGWRGVVVPFDWPSDNSTLNYLEDRSDAAAVAGSVVKEVIPLLVTAQGERTPSGQPACTINVHLLGHSTGAYLIMEAMAASQKVGEHFRSDWRIGQCAFIGGDVAASSLRKDCDWAAPLFSRVQRLTNYSNGADQVLAVSNAKRLGTAPRAGRVGLPEGTDAKAVNVDCTEYFFSKDPKQSTYEGTFCHSWHLGDQVFANDFAMTLSGAIDRHYLPTRESGDRGLRLKAGKPLAHPIQWTDIANVSP